MELVEVTSCGKNEPSIFGYNVISWQLYAVDNFFQLMSSFFFNYKSALGNLHLKNVTFVFMKFTSEKSVFFRILPCHRILWILQYLKPCHQFSGFPTDGIF